jgi:hypothetical protein
VDNQEESEGKRQRTALVFDRLEVSSGKGGERTESVFDRLEETMPHRRTLRGRAARANESIGP